jgi:cbb3-type cytochrome oxidase subunit 3
MRRNGVIIIILLILIALIFWFFFKKKKDPTSEYNEEDRIALQQDSAASDNSQPQDPIVFPNTPVGNLLQNHMMVLAMPAETIEEADAKLAASLAELKKNKEEAVSLLADAYKKTEARHYFNRWGLVKTLGDLESNTATKHLTDIALAPIPQETSKDLHHFSTQEEEVIIKVRAIEGLGTLAKAGDRTADAVLLRLALDSTNKNTAIQLRAIKAYLRAGKDTNERAKLLTSRLDKSMHDIITTAVTAPEEFTQKMETIKQLSADSTKGEKYDGPATRLPAPVVK